MRHSATATLFGCCQWGERQFALFGAYGQRICVDPVSKLILVQTAVDQGVEIWSLWKALIEQFGKP
jgi:hypothetical protein